MSREAIPLLPITDPQAELSDWLEIYGNVGFVRVVVRGKSRGWGWKQVGSVKQAGELLCFKVMCEVERGVIIVVEGKDTRT